MTAQIGVGPVAAARSTERLLDRLTVDHVVVSGIAGGIDPTSTIGSVIVPEIMLDVASGQEYRPSPLGTLERAGTVGTVDELIMDPLRLAATGRTGSDSPSRWSPPRSARSAKPEACPGR